MTATSRFFSTLLLSGKLLLVYEVFLRPYGANAHRNAALTLDVNKEYGNEPTKSNWSHPFSTWILLRT